MAQQNGKVNRAPHADPLRARESMKRLMNIYREISQTADEVSTWRCPYKSARGRCTANFGCRNQYFVSSKDDDRPICTGSDKLDYRKAWEI